MTLPPIGAARARDLIASFADVPVLVVGDVMLDRFIVGRVSRISPEAPVPVVRFESEHVRLGGAANVAHNIAALGGTPLLVGVTGNDAAAGTLRHELQSAGISDRGVIVDSGRPTVEKVRIVTERNQQVSRVDYESDHDIAGDVLTHVTRQIGEYLSAARVVLVSDYLKGAITSEVMRGIAALSRAPLIVDPKIPHLDLYAGATLITPNHHEAEHATHRRVRTDDDARAAGAELRSRVRARAALITRGEHGMWLSSPDADGAIPAITREVSDVTGAGDTVTATLALAVAAGATLAEAASLANHAAGVVVGKFGAATVSPGELLAAFEDKGPANTLNAGNVACR